MMLPYQIPRDEPRTIPPRWAAFVDYTTGQDITPLPQILDPSGKGFFFFHWDAEIQEACGRVVFDDNVYVRVDCTRESSRILSGSPTPIPIPTVIVVA